MNLKLETWTALAALGLSAMFVALLLSFYNFLIGPEGEGPQRVVEPGSLLLQLVFISAAPCLVLAGVVFGMSMSFGTKPGGILLIAAGIIMMAGAAVGTTMVPQIQHQYIVGGVGVAPYIFISGGAGVTAVGGYLLAISGRSKRYSSLDDLR
jgi:hypothetical protein